MKKLTLFSSLLFLGVLFVSCPTSLLAASTSVPAVDLSVGSRGENVVWLQQHLIAKDTGVAARALGAATATGYFGTLTRAALAEYQAAHAITPSQGYFGPKTRAVIAKDTTQHLPTFTGTVEAVNTGCFADGICSVTVSGKEVILLTGMRAGMIPPVGKLIGVESVGDLENRIGARAKVYAATTTEGGAGYTLYGSADYYVEVMAKGVPADGPITVRGVSTCLPPKDPSKPTILMCALGLRGDDGNYYALHDTDTEYKNVSRYGSGTHIEVKGTFKKEDGGTWNSVGTIEVTDITEVT